MSIASYEELNRTSASSQRGLDHGCLGPMAPTPKELQEARAHILRDCARPGSPATLFPRSEANIAAARRLRDEGLITVEDGEDDAGVRHLVLTLTAKGVDHLKKGGN